jgi:hypothetical protein
VYILNPTIVEIGNPSLCALKTILYVLSETFITSFKSDTWSLLHTNLNVEDEEVIVVLLFLSLFIVIVSSKKK